MKIVENHFNLGVNLLFLEGTKDPDVKQDQVTK